MSLVTEKSSFRGMAIQDLHTTCTMTLMDQGYTFTPAALKTKLLTHLLSSVMSSAVQGMPRVMSDNEFTTGLTKASPVVIPDKMPMTTLNLDLD